MLILFAGLILFLGLHFVPALPEVRLALVKRWGERYYKAAFSLLSFVGLALIIGGYAVASPGPRLFEPSWVAIAIAPYAMTLSFILFAAAYLRSHIRRSIGHPMLLGLAIWASVHLLANGDTRGTVLFASFLAYAAADFVSVELRHATKSFVPSVRYDLIAVLAGTIAALAVMALHRRLFGVAAVAWGS